MDDSTTSTQSLDRFNEFLKNLLSYVPSGEIIEIIGLDRELHQYRNEIMSYVLNLPIDHTNVFRGYRDYREHYISEELCNAIQSKCMEDEISHLDSLDSSIESNPTRQP